jgi:hypothetical protein
MYDQNSYIRDSKTVERWLAEQSPDLHEHNARPAELMEDILNTLQDDIKSKQIRHYVAALCSLKDEHIVAFCETLLPNYFVFSFLAMINKKLEPAMLKRTHDLEKKLSLWSRHLEKTIE